MTAHRRGLTVIALALAGAGPLDSVAEPPPVAGAASAVVRWQAPAGCPDAAAVRARLDARLPRPLGEGDAIDATVTVVRARGSFRAHVAVWTPAADVDRELFAPRCAELADAVAVVLARAVAEARALAPAEAPGCDPLSPFDDCPAGGPERGQPSRQSPFALSEPQRGESKGPRRDGGVRPALVSGAGIGPHVGYGLELGVWFVWGAGAVEITGTRWLERLAELPPSRRFGAAIGLDAIAARVCWNPDRFGPRVCALGELGTMTGRGVGLFDARVGEAIYSAAGVGVSLRAPLRPHVALVAGFDMLRVVDRPRFVLDRGTLLHQPDALAGRVALGLELGWR